MMRKKMGVHVKRSVTVKADVASARVLSVDYTKSVVGAVEREASLPLRDRLQVTALD